MTSDSQLMYTKLNKIDWDKLKVFYAVAHAGTYEKAGALIGMAQSGISKSITQLESELGVTLINRKKGAQGKILTDAGETILKMTSGMYKLLEESISEIEDTENISGRITIATARGFGTTWLFPKLVGFMKLYPEIKIDLTYTNNFFSLVEYPADLYLTPKVLDHPDFVHDFLDEFSFGIYASKRYCELYGIPKAPEDLDHHKIIIYKFSTAYPQLDWLVTAGLPRGMKREAYLTLDDVHAGISAVQNDLGMSLFIEYVGNYHQDLVRLFSDTHIGSFKIFLVTDKKSKKLKRLDLLINYLKNS